MKEKKPKSPPNKYIRFTSLGFEMVATILLASLLGDWIDAKAETTTPYFTLLFMLLGVFASMYRLFRTLIKDNDPQ